MVTKRTMTRSIIHQRFLSAQGLFNQPQLDLATSQRQRFMRRLGVVKIGLFQTRQGFLKTPLPHQSNAKIPAVLSTRFRFGDFFALILGRDIAQVGELPQQFLRSIRVERLSLHSLERFPMRIP